MKRLKQRLIISFFLFLLSTLLLIGSSYAWFTKLIEEDYTGTFGFVDVDVELYFDDGEGGKIPATEYQITPTDLKTGVYNINITEPASFNHFKKLRVDVLVKSNIDTYLRVKMFEQLTLKYTNFEGIETELSILVAGFMPFEYDLSDWYDNREIDNYLYYRLKTKRINETTPMKFELIIEFPEAKEFVDYSAGYSLQIAISIEAVQWLLGPQNVWQLPTAPWGASW